MASRDHRPARVGPVTTAVMCDGCERREEPAIRLSGFLAASLPERGCRSSSSRRWCAAPPGCFMSDPTRRALEAVARDARLLLASCFIYTACTAALCGRFECMTYILVLSLNRRTSTPLSPRSSLCNARREVRLPCLSHTSTEKAHACRFTRTRIANIYISGGGRA